MKPGLLAAALCLAAAPALPAVDPALLNLAMPNPQALTGVLVGQVQSSAFGQYVLSKIQVDSNLARIMAATGFDPRKDLHELVAAAASKNTGLVIGRGVFQPSRIAAAAVMAGAVSSTYRGLEVLTASAQHPLPNGTLAQNSSFAFLDSTLVVLGDTMSVEAAIDRYIAGAKLSGPLAQQAMQVSAGNDIWFVASQLPAAFFPGKAPNQGFGNLANAFQSIQQTSGGVKFSSNGAVVSLALVADSPQNAQSLVDIGKFLVSLVDSNRGQNPGAAKAASIADTAVFSASGSVATVNLTLSEQQLEQLLMPAGGAQPSRRAAAR
ncbi:MAG TPA: hypothetical protein VKV74_09310 [Bryobacteraceae bacterium]|nr:hypothetical protein [Bryobacteraceae bacterium]